ncbi:hypothetical protein L6452_31770 [Arctium lappa]|uniref:Uncharacterized protein n=1 Tax=Arctium lappa TaxID=4217 RepID=A0ACB8Z3C4_ARCLA|nr:hypothetical protein L6452_31770 [Arctium lappa]
MKRLRPPEVSPESGCEDKVSVSIGSWPESLKDNIPVDVSPDLLSKKPNLLLDSLTKNLVEVSPDFLSRKPDVSLDLLTKNLIEMSPESVTIEDKKGVDASPESLSPESLPFNQDKNVDEIIEDKKTVNASQELLPFNQDKNVDVIIEDKKTVNASQESVMPPESPESFVIEDYASAEEVLSEEGLIDQDSILPDSIKSSPSNKESHSVVPESITISVSDEEPMNVNIMEEPITIVIDPPLQEDQPNGMSIQAIETNGVRVDERSTHRSNIAVETTNTSRQGEGPCGTLVGAATTLATITVFNSYRRV